MKNLMKEVAFQAKSRTVRRHVGSVYQELRRSERLPLPRLLELQRQRAQGIARFAAEHTEFYPEWFAQNGVQLDALGATEAWQSLPILDRRIFKEHAQEFYSDEATPSTQRKALTGGSTGEPLRVAHDTRFPASALSWRMYSWWGVNPWDNLARIARWGLGRKETVKNAVSWWPTRQDYLDAPLINEASKTTFVETLQKARPVLLEGYVGAMLEFADYVERHGVELDSLKAIATTAAPLTAGGRARIAEVLHAPVYDEYRSSEVGWMAGECSRHEGLHVFADTRLIEVVDAGGQPCAPGETGDILLTDLTNRVFPLIRYRNGDRGALLPGPCSCGLTLPLMAPVEGRTTDVLRMPSGAALNYRLMGMFSEHPDAVRLFRLHQRADYSLLLTVVRGPARDAETQIEAVAEQLRERISHEVPLTVEYADSLPYTGGKVKYVSSDVPVPLAV